MAVHEISSELRRRIEREASDLKPTRLTPDAVSWGEGPDPGKVWISGDLSPITARNVERYAMLDRVIRRLAP